MTHLLKQELFHIPTLFASLKATVYFCLMLGFGEAYLIAFAIHLNATPFQLGILGLIPLCIAAPCQWLGYRMTEYLGDRRSICHRGACVQASLWLCFAALAMGTWSYYPVYSLILLSAGYFGLTAFVTPAWNSLIGDIVPNASRGYFFGYVNRRSGILLLIGMIVAGSFLQAGAYGDFEELAFFCIFIIAAVFRFRSSRWLGRHDNPDYRASEESSVQPGSFFRDLFRTPLGRYIVFSAGFRGIAQLELPFYALFMLQYLNLSYASFMIVCATGFSAQFALSQVWGELSDQVGNRKVLILCASGLVFTPVLWLLSHDVLYLLLLQLLTGYFWAGFNLSSLSFMFDLIQRVDRAKVSAYASFVTSGLCLCGGLIGAFVMEGMLHGNGVISKLDSSHQAFVILFAGSSLLRLMFVSLTMKSVMEVRRVQNISNKELLVRISHVRPLWGTFSMMRIRKKEESMKDSALSVSRTQVEVGP